MCKLKVRSQVKLPLRKSLCRSLNSPCKMKFFSLLCKIRPFILSMANKLVKGIFSLRQACVFFFYFNHGKIRYKQATSLILNENKMQSITTYSQSLALLTGLGRSCPEKKITV